METDKNRNTDTADDRISENFTWSEMERSDTARRMNIDNTVPEGPARHAVVLLVTRVLQPLRTAWGRPLVINSGYRSPELNAAVGGVPDSQHVRGEAADIAAPDPLLLAQTVVRNRLPFDQMILYSTFVHISHRPRGPQRGQILYDISYRQHYPHSPEL